jgi:hypothetical protein
MKTLGVISVLALVLAATATAATPRLTAAQWASYTKAHTAFTKQTPKSVARFRSCLKSTTGSREARAMQRCFGNTGDLELTATNNLITVMNRFQNKLAGPCNDAYVNYQKALFFWKSTVTGVVRAVHSNVASVSSIEANANQAALVYPKVTKASLAFGTACKPKS